MLKNLANGFFDGMKTVFVVSGLMAILTITVSLLYGFIL